MDLVMSEAERLLGLDDIVGSDVEALEAFIINCNNASANLDGEPLVEDAIYDRLIELLREAKPDSDLLTHLWDDNADPLETSPSGQGTDSLLKLHPMTSIQTVKSWNDNFLDTFVSNVDSLHEENEAISLFFAYKINGHGVRVVYQNGDLVKATSRARNSRGRDITRQMRNILGARCEALADMDLVEIRGEVCLKLANLPVVNEMREAAGEKKLASAFSAVSSLLKPASTVEENKLLDFLAYRYYDTVGVLDTREEEYAQLESFGFDVPDYSYAEIEEQGTVVETMQSILSEYEENYEEFGYFCDGVVCEVNERELFESLGTNGSRNNGNVALKVGVWAQDKYAGFVQAIKWKRGTHKMSPVAIIADAPGKAILGENGEVLNMDDMGVLVAQGNSIKNIPLYEPRNILKLGAFIGEPLNFQYGGEAGVVPLQPNGLLLKDDAARNLLTN